MDSQEIKQETEMSYDELVVYLQNKYGTPERAYFRTPTCKSKSPITRGKEGLYIHHVKETEADDLSKTEQALTYPWIWQLPENLCYCNLLEHLLLHIHINILRCRDKNVICVDGLYNYIIPSINHIFIKKPVYTAQSQLWRNTVTDSIKDNYEEYKDILQLYIYKLNNLGISCVTLEALLAWEGTLNGNSSCKIEAFIDHFRSLEPKTKEEKASGKDNKRSKKNRKLKKQKNRKN